MILILDDEFDAIDEVSAAVILTQEEFARLTKFIDFRSSPRARLCEPTSD